MPVTGYAQSKFPINLMKLLISDLNGAGTSIKCCLMTSLATPLQETWDSYADVVTDTHEVVGAGYTAGGAACTANAVTEAAKVTKFDANDATWTPNVTITARHAIVYDDTPAGNANKKLIAWFDLGADYGVLNGVLTITWNASGICTITVA